MSWTTALGSSYKDKRYAGKCTDRKRLGRKFSHLSTAIKFPTRRSLSCLIWFYRDILSGKNYFYIGIVYFVIQSGTWKFYSGLTLKSSDEPQWHSFLAYLNPPLEVPSLRNCILKNVIHFSVKFIRIQSWNFFFHTVMLLAINFNSTLIC